MRIVISALGILAALLAAVPAGVAAEKEPSSTVASPASARHRRPEDEKAIRQLVDDFVAAYNGHDAPAIAGLFTSDGMIADEDGKVTRDRAAIEKVFAGIFKEHPNTRIEDTIESIRFVGPAEAVEDGITTVVHDKETPAEKNRYRAVHVKREGKWQMASAVDLPEDAWTGADQLNQLAGLIGDWVDENPDALVLTSYRWTDNRRFILGQFTVQIGGKPAMTGTQRIGWDPLKKTIRSWVFDSEGGFAEGLWTRDGNKWAVKLTGVTRDGKPSAATHTITQMGKDRMILQTVDRVIGNEKMPDGEKILVVRRPPPPK
jgi:uncharacterized protein (TIGR02246 family)